MGRCVLWARKYGTYPVMFPCQWSRFLGYTQYPPTPICMTKGLLYQRSVTLISKQRPSGHIGDVTQPLALDRRSQLASQSYHIITWENVLVFSHRVAFVGARGFLKVAI